MKLIIHSLVTILVICATPAHAGKWNFGGYIGETNLDNTRATREGIGDSATIFGGYAEFDTDSLLAVNMGAEYIDYDDLEGFQQRVWQEYYWGRDEIVVESSDAYGFFIFADAGPKWKFGNGYFTVAGGYNMELVSERSIANCENCYEEDIKIESGAYAKIGVGGKAGPVSLGVQYRHYLDSDDGLESSFMLSVGTAF